jgi:3-hydroxy-9,10-secoandrosta-1,3,5(10)-triene-9,17-dione monooxygenase
VSEQPLEGLLDRIRALVPLVAERAAEAEVARKPDDDVIEALKASGVFRSFVPKRFGGYEIDLELFLDIGVAVSEACASTGWITTFYMEHNWLLGNFSAEVQEEVFSRQPFVLAPGSVNPKDGVASPKGEGYELTGHWRFGTGIVHADWVVLTGRIATEPDGPPRMFLVRPEDVEVRDTWHVDGMAATGSRDIVANAVYVPERHVSQRAMGVVGKSGEYLASIPVLPMLSLTAAIPSVGAARRAVELFRRLLAERVPFGTNKTQSYRAPSQMRLARGLADVRSAETVLRAVARDLTAHARGGPQLSFMDQIQMRLTIAHVVRDCRRVVRDVMEGSGASVRFLDQELSRISRDVQMMGAHTVFDLDLVAELCGRALLEANAPLFPPKST